ncbi:MAG: 50S ribosomal protein L29 [Gemmatimonadetes bacterium]|nr:50S ribosomal protein L29 [Gemmatimonadota bacterium]
MTPEEIRDWPDSEIEVRIRELTEERFKLRFQEAMMELDDPSLPRKVRRDLARLHTVRRERQLAAAESAGS